MKTSGAQMRGREREVDERGRERERSAPVGSSQQTQWAVRVQREHLCACASAECARGCIRRGYIRALARTLPVRKDRRPGLARVCDRDLVCAMDLAINH